jgi:uncharacterized protein YbbC (DUF1343 family)
MIATGLDRLLAAPERLAGRRYGLLAHAASIAVTASGTGGVRPAHRALARLAAAPAVLFGPEHGYYGIEQDMVASGGGRDPWTGVPIHSLYGDSADSLAPRPEAFAGLDLLLIDLQDVGSRYYTYAATAVWAAAAALAAGCEVWVLDRPNPLGGEIVEGNLPEPGPQPGFESFVGAFKTPVRHGLTLGELVLLEAKRRRWDGRFTVLPMAGWRRGMSWEETGLPWIAPSPNMPTTATALVYPGGCLVEATALSEGRGTTRPFQLTGAPGLDPVALADRLTALALPGIAFLPTYFRPQFQKHAGEVCGGVELVVTDPASFRSYRAGVELLAEIRELHPDLFAWRQAPYEFVADRPAIDLLTQTTVCREAIDGGRRDDLRAWFASWEADESAFRAECAEILLYS